MTEDGGQRRDEGGGKRVLLLHQGFGGQVRTRSYPSIYLRMELTFGWNGN